MITQGKRRYGLDRDGPAALLRGARSEGGASPRVKDNADKAEARSYADQVPWILAKMYASSPVVNTDQSREEGAGMVDRLYIPVTPDASEKARPASEKLKNWFLKGVWK
jgi:hypothetical protein